MAPPEDAPNPLLHAAVAVIAIVIAVELYRIDGATRSWVAFGIFGAAYLTLMAVTNFAPPLWLAIQTAAALAMVRFTHHGLEAALLVVIAGEAPFLLSRPAARAWIAFQCAALLALDWARFDSFTEGVRVAVPFIGFQLFALGAGLLAERESRARRELARLNAELLATRELLTDSTRSGERLRIARDLHDALGHQLAALSLSLERAGHAATAPNANDAARARIHESRELARELLAKVREAVSTMRADSGVELRPAIDALTLGLARPRVHLRAPESLALRSPAHAHTLFSCVQVVITNALRHAGASNLWIDIEAKDGGFEVRARDDGRGAERVEPGNGLRGMRERFDEAGGRVEIAAEPGRGFSVRAFLPTGGAP